MKPSRFLSFSEFGKPVFFFWHPTASQTADISSGNIPLINSINIPNCH
jgi:hypothetical protein